MKNQKSCDEYIRLRTEEKSRLIDIAAGRQRADLVLKNAVYVNVFSNALSRADIAVTEGRVAGLGHYSGAVEIDLSDKIVLPGFIDAHIHLESAMVSPAEFARAVLPHGTTAVVTDPHEIANVMGTDGIEYMLQATEGLPVDVNFMLPSCVPSTPLDESGAELDWRAIDRFLDHRRVLGLAEMMNSYGVIQNDPGVIAKIAAAQAHHKIIDGHAPDLTGGDLNAYVAAGIYSDHECYTAADALAKLERGQHIMIREGTAAHNLEALLPLLTAQYADRCMFCCDDKHPSDLLNKGHIDLIVKRAIAAGADPISAVKAAGYNAARYFGMNDRGAIAPGYLADIVVIDSFESFRVEKVFKRGALCYDNGILTSITPPETALSLAERARSTFRIHSLTAADFALSEPRSVIGMIPGEIVTRDAGRAAGTDVSADILKIAVIERHRGTGHIGLGYISGYGLRSGAVATSISHDSHNLIVVGTNEADMAAAANRVIENRGGIVVAEGKHIKAEVSLAIAGLMSEQPLEQVNEALEAAKAAAFALGVNREIDPFMTLSFMSLPVIPALRITTRGIVDVNTQQYI